MEFNDKNFILKDGVFDFDIKDPITAKIAKFYEENPFPNYKSDDDKYTILKTGDSNLLMRELKKFVGFNKSLLEVGSGTSQLSNYLAIGTNNKIYAFDSSLQSLKLGKKFSEKNNIRNTIFVRGDIFDKIFKKEVFDFVWCNGVLHHTKNPYEAFRSLIPHVKKNGYIFIGLYNKIGRFRTKLRKNIQNKDQEKINAWIKDQYTHPLENTHTFDEILKWFKMNDIKFINSIPECSPFNNLKKNIFENNSKSTFVERILQQFVMIFTRFGSEGGVFLFIGKKIK